MQTFSRLSAMSTRDCRPKRAFACSGVTLDQEADRGIETVAASVLNEQVFQKQGKALLVFGAAHFYLTGPEDYLSSMGDDVGLARRLDRDHPGRTFVVIPVGGLARPPAVKADVDPPTFRSSTALSRRRCAQCWCRSNACRSGSSQPRKFLAAL